MSATAPGPLLRRGPRPLLLHLMLAMLKSNASLGVSPSWSGASPIWSAEALEQVRLIAEALRDDGDADPTRQSIFQAAMSQDRALIAGIAAYRRHPWRRELPDPPERWREGGSRVLDYGGAGPTLLLVPSLINRAHVLDLAPGHSMARWLAVNGVRTLLLDWGWPGQVERTFTLTDYVAGRLERAIMALDAPLLLGGYCMGGLLTLAAAQRRPDRVRGLALLATPWDFHAADRDRATGLARIVPMLEPLMAIGGAVPIDVLQMMFAMLEPYGIAEKYRAFGRLDQNSERARLFVSLEDWLNDGIPLAAPVARECLAGWYGENTPGRGMWRIAGLPVDPATIRVPTLVAVPARDRIVPPESARPLGVQIPGATLLEPAAGHIGMAAGSSAERVLWQPLRDWALGIPARAARAPGGDQPSPQRRRTKAAEKPRLHPSRGMRRDIH